MADGYLLSQRSVRELRGTKERVQDTRLNPSGRPEVGEFDQDATPDNFWAITPEDGIPGRIGLAPGYADCYVYRIVGHGLTSSIDEVPNLFKRVYNVSTEAVPGSRLIYIKKDKWGYYFAEEVEEGIGTGTGTDSTSSGNGQCDLAGIKTSDCLVATGLGQTLTLRGGGSSWTSEIPSTGTADESGTAGTGTGSGTGEPPCLNSEGNFEYPGGCGPIVFWYAAGQTHLSLNGSELLNCGNGCFTGGPLTGHVPEETGTGTGSGTTTSDSCAGETFTICVACSTCPIPGFYGAGWYCIDSDGTGTGTLCVSFYLEEEDGFNESIVICSGPYDTEAEALVYCDSPPIVPVLTACCTSPSSVWIILSEVFSTGSPIHGMARLNWDYDEEMYDGTGVFNFNSTIDPEGADCGTKTLRYQAKCVSYVQTGWPFDTIYFWSVRVSLDGGTFTPWSWVTDPLAPTPPPAEFSQDGQYTEGSFNQPGAVGGGVCNWNRNGVGSEYTAAYVIGYPSPFNQCGTLQVSWSETDSIPP